MDQSPLDQLHLPKLYFKVYSHVSRKITRYLFVVVQLPDKLLKVVLPDQPRLGCSTPFAAKRGLEI